MESLKREPITMEQVIQAQQFQTGDLNNQYLRLRNQGQELQNEQTRQNIELMNSPWWIKIIAKFLGINPKDLGDLAKDKIPKGGKNDKKGKGTNSGSW